MTPAIRNVIVVGAGGNLGPSIVKALVDDHQFTVSILARQSSKSEFPSHVKVHRVADSYPEDELLKIFQGQDAIVSAITSLNILQQLSLINAAVKAGIQRFIPAEFGGNKEYSKNGEPLPSHGDKVKILEHLKDLEIKGMSWTAIATGPFFDWGLRTGFLGFDLKSRQALIYGSGDEKWSGTKVSTIGLAVARTLARPEETKNKFIYVYSISTSQNQVLAALRKVTGDSWEVDHTSMEAAIESGREKLGRGERAGVVPIILSYFYRDGMGADYARDVEAANELLQLPEENLEDLIREGGVGEREHHLHHGCTVYIIILTWGAVFTSPLVIASYGIILFIQFGISGFIPIVPLQIWTTVAIPGNLVGAFRIDRFGRRPFMLIGAIGLVVILVFECALQAGYTGTDNKSGQIAAIFFIYVFIVVYTGFIDATQWVYLSEIYPTHIRGLGAGIGIFNWDSSSIVLQVASPIALNNIGWKFFFVLIIPTAFYALGIYLTLPEKSRKSLDDINADFGEVVAVRYFDPTAKDAKEYEEAFHVEDARIDTTAAEMKA